MKRILVIASLAASTLAFAATPPAAKPAAKSDVAQTPDSGHQSAVSGKKTKKAKAEAKDAPKSSTETATPSKK